MRPRTSWLATCGLVLAVCAALALSDASRPACAAQETSPEGESQRRCGCPLMPEERILIPCQDPARPERCGSCTVVTAAGKRDGRPCVGLPYESPR